MSSSALEFGSASDNANTLAHEGYHAYQDYAERHSDLHADQAQLERWMNNDAEGNYIPYEQDPEGYAAQPVEADAFAYGDRVEHLLYK